MLQIQQYLCSQKKFGFEKLYTLSEKCIRRWHSRKKFYWHFAKDIFTASSLYNEEKKMREVQMSTRNIGAKLHEIYINIWWFEVSHNKNSGKYLETQIRMTNCFRRKRTNRKKETLKDSCAFSLLIVTCHCGVPVSSSKICINQSTYLKIWSKKRVSQDSAPA